MASPVLVLRVAARHQAGLFYPPPAMFRDIYDWVLAVVAATVIKKKGQGEPQDFSRYDPVLQAAETYKANPTNWKLYSALIEAMWIFGAQTRGSVKDFQKLTPERKRDLEERANRLYALVQQQVQSVKDSRTLLDQREEAEVAKLRQYLLSGVSAITGDTVEKDFPIDLGGWKYGEDEIRKRVDEIVKQEKERAKKFYEEQKDREVKPELEEYKQDLLKHLKREMEGSGWDSIKVVLTEKAIQGAKAYWQGITRRIVITIPYGSDPHSLAGLASTLRHEMQHFSQSYLAWTLGAIGGTGLPSEKIRTPEFQQWMSPTHPSHRPDDPKLKELFMKLRREGIPPQRVNFHDLDDVEFYTELVDAIDEFKTHLSHAPKGPLNIAVKLFTGILPEPRSHDKDWYQQMEALGGYDFAKWFTTPNAAFLAWKTHAPGKYKKALKEFVSAVG